jgi:hypothetical protein
MNITRDNYEEFFILYLDNELNSVDRGEVERFVNENPDLKNELELLLQTRMTPDHNLVFDGKEQLLKTDLPAPINKNNFEEWLLLYIDNELTSQQKIAIEEFVAGHPPAETALQQLQKTKFQPEYSVIFPNKEALYRREKRTPVIALRVWRVAVAAALLVAISTAAFFVLNDNKKNEQNIAAETGTKVTNDDSADKRINDAAVNNTEVTKSDDESQPAVDPSDNLVAGKQKNAVVENEKARRVNKSSQKEEEKLIVENTVTPQQKTNNLAEPKNNPNVTKATEENPIAKVDLPKQEPLTTIIDNNSIDAVTPDNASSLHDGKTAVPIEPDYALGTDDDGKKNKLRGFFRKVTRTFEKRTNIKATDDEDRLLLAGLSIKL